LVDILFNCFVFQLCTAQLLEMCAHCANTDIETLSAFIDSSTVSLMFFCFKPIQTHQLLFEFITISKRHNYFMAIKPCNRLADGAQRSW